MGLDTSKSANELAIALADIILSEMRKGSEGPLALLNLFVPPSRKEAWEKLGVIPGGLNSEVRDALTKTMSNINTDPVDLLLTCVRLAISTGYMGLVGTITLQDILLGTPSLVESQADLGIIDQNTVNIVAHG